MVDTIFSTGSDYSVNLSIIKVGGSYFLEEVIVCLSVCYYNFVALGDLHVVVMHIRKYSPTT